MVRSFTIAIFPLLILSGFIVLYCYSTNQTIYDLIITLVNIAKHLIQFVIELINRG